jgi:hypothetical protein
MTEYELRVLISCVDAGVYVGCLYPDQKDDLIDTLKSAYATIHTAKEREKKLIQAAADLGTYFCFEEEKRVADESQVYKRAGLKELE